MAIAPGDKTGLVDERWNSQSGIGGGWTVPQLTASLGSWVTAPDPGGLKEVECLVWGTSSWVGQCPGVLVPSS